METKELATLDAEELQVVLKLLEAKLPPVLVTLDEGGNGWRQIMTIACYLLAATFNRHPEYIQPAMSLLATLEGYYPTVEANFAVENPGLVSGLIANDAAFLVVPDSSVKKVKVQ